MRKLCWLRWLPVLFPVVLAAVAGAQSNRAAVPERNIYVAAFDGCRQADALQERVSRYLEKSRTYRVVTSPGEAGITLKGSCQIWIRGYVSANTRTPANDRQAVYSGYLAVQAIDKSGEPLWSWLATPGRLAWHNIVDDLANQCVKKLVENKDLLNSSSSGAETVQALKQTELSGSGATFPAPLYQKWFEDFEAQHLGVRVRYAPVGSQAGTDALLAGKVDFAGSDIAPEAHEDASDGSHLHRIASVMGAVVAIYHLEGTTEDLHLTPETLADIFTGKVTRWDDPEIRQSNKGIALPSAGIHVFHRQDGSGTTWVWSDFLAKVNPAWAAHMGKSATLSWTTGTGVNGSEKMAEAVQGTANSIGYVELSYAIQKQLTFAAVRNRSGEFVHANLDSLAEAAASSGHAGAMAGDITDAPGKYAYPISAFTWILVPEKTADTGKKTALRELLRWVLTKGQRECATLGYAPLPKETAEAQIRAVNQLH